MHRRLLFYVSGHGLGHGVRSAEIVRALAARGGVDEIHVRTSAPVGLFAGIPGTLVRVQPVCMDPGAVESSPLAVDAARTLASVAEVLSRREAIVAGEAGLLRGAGISAVASDAPFLAGEIAAAAGLPCFALTNFTWDWIYEPLVETLPRYAPALEAVREGYRKMAGWFRLPFHHASSLFPSVVDVPLVARHPRHPPEEVLAALALDPADARPRVLIAMRGGIPPEILRRAASGSPDFLFLDLAESPGPALGNLRRVAVPPGMTFTDVLSVCPLAVSKLGYGVVAECVSAGVGILWVARSGFREDQVMRREAPRVLRLQEIPVSAYGAGDWSGYLARLAAAPAPPERMRTDGAEVCAGILADAAAR